MIKLIEKLGQEYAEDLNSKMTPIAKTRHARSFEAGFRVAREMAMTQAIVCTDKPNPNEDAVILGPKFLAELAQLGEEEVESE